ncbi:rhomboid family intramembrane serine protease [Nocardioides dongkuii]|uniref:rhomboid family intramembrane serine protease n=1 Tax=Nocardioides dongkuii TaxID=2760089 RepID=UPI0015F8EE5F|nr:rhomboid family intramembrane serine protease [Nocardioides dongkuii]
MTQPSEPAGGVPTCYRHPDRETYIRCQRCDRPICPDCMRDAAVGFHCPECVAEAARTTRQARTAYGGLRPGNAAITSMVLIGVNLAVFVLVLGSGGSGGELFRELVLRPAGFCAGAFGVPEGQCGPTWVPGVADGAYWQLLTSTFLHTRLLHLGFNMLALYWLGPQLELLLGRVRFLALYLLSGLTGSAVVYWAAPEYQATLGASGSIYGLFGAMLVVAYKIGGQVQQILVLIGVNLFITFAIPGISWQGHLGGLLGGAAIAAILVYAPRGPRRTAFQTGGLLAIALLTAIAIIARTAVLA